MKTPGYWKNKGFYARLLLPVGMLYSAATAFRFKLKQPRKVPVPVICIGNPDRRRHRQNADGGGDCQPVEKRRI